MLREAGGNLQMCEDDGAAWACRTGHALRCVFCSGDAAAAMVVVCCLIEFGVALRRAAGFVCVSPFCWNERSCNEFALHNIRMPLL